MTNAIQKAPEPETIVVHRDVSGPLEFSSEQIELLRNGYAPGATETEFRMLLEVAKLRRLNPFLKQIHFVKRKSKDDNGNWRETWTSQVAIDGLRAIAQRTGLYDGQDDVTFERDKDGLILSARVAVYRKDWSRPAIGVARWSEYVQTTRDGTPTKFWNTMPHVMIGKCAEALALRKAFPEDMSDLYTEEEMQQADNAQHADTGTNGERMSPHAGPGESTADAPKQSDRYDAILKSLLAIDEWIARKGTITYQDVLVMREQVGTKAKPSTITRQISEMVNSGEIAPGQRAELGKLWNRLDRQITRLEGEIQAPPVEVLFNEPEREPGADEDEPI